MAIASVVADINGVNYTMTYNSSTQKYECTFTAPAVTSYNVPGGIYHVNVTATDDYGNTYDEEAPLTVKETTPPVITLISPSDAALIGTSTPQIIFSVTDEANGSGVDLNAVYLYIDGAQATGTMQTTAITNGYRFSYTPPTALSNGSHNYYVEASDHDENMVETNAWAFTIDTIAPTLNVITPTNNLKTNAATCVVSGTTNDATSSVAGITITLNGTDQGTVTVNSNGSFSKTVSLAVGTNTIVVTSTDAAGKATSVTRTVLVNRTKPTITNLVLSPNPVNVNGLVTFTCTVTDA